MKENLQKFNGIFIEVENKSPWIKASNDKIIYKFLEDIDFFPIANDQYNNRNQYNVIFLKKKIIKKYSDFIKNYFLESKRLINN